MARRYVWGFAIAVTAGLVLTTPAEAQQTGTLNGYLKIAGTDGPVMNARVQMVNADFFVITDESGYFAMERVQNVSLFGEVLRAEYRRRSRDVGRGALGRGDLDFL